VGRSSVPGREGTMRSSQKVVADRDLRQRCLGNDPAAWQELFRRQQTRLGGIIARLLQGRVVDENVVDEIRAKVWHALIEHEYGQLRVYEPDRASLDTYFGLLAYRQVVLWVRSNRCRHAHEATLPPEEPVDPRAVDGLTEAYLRECLEILGPDLLSPKERKVFDEFLMRVPDGRTRCTLSDANVWKLTQRVRAKLLALLADR
jgi:DNA-directed RNA polymerase specialized sigma24 family protein